MKTTTTIISFLLFISMVNAQSWQQEFQLPGVPEFLEESSEGELMIHYFDTLNLSFTRLRIDQNGNTIGTEIYQASPNNTHSIVSVGTERLLRYFDNTGNLVWEIPVEVPASTLVTTTNSGLAILYYFEGNASNSLGKIWLYDQEGTLQFQRIKNGPSSLSGWQVHPKHDGSVILTAYSSDPWLPQGASQSFYQYFLFDQSGVEICNEYGNFSAWNGSKYVSDIALNGAGNCGAIGTIFQGANFPDNPEGQFIPCSNQLVPFDFAIPHGIEMIGLQSNGFATLGLDEDKTVLTRIDCGTPVINALCLGPIETFIHVNICHDETYSIGNNLLNTSGDYQFDHLTDQGCDSTVHLQLIVDSTIISIEPEITISDDSGIIELNANCSDCSYVWSNGGVLEDLTVTELGVYSVTITTPGGCQDSFDFNLISTSLSEAIADEFYFNIPNPAPRSTRVSISSDHFLNKNYTLKIFDLNGRIQGHHKMNDSLSNEFNLPERAGVYFIGLFEEGRLVKYEKVVVV